jgi:1,4-dihydroxy-2-naphthoate octaprenyltransferase
MDAIKRLFTYVEIKTKITSVFSFLMTFAYLVVKGIFVDPLRSTVFFFGMFLFDLTATTINNYNDTKSNHQTLTIPRKTALIITFLLLALSTALGIWLVALTDIVVLLAGTLCFLFGILYSFGPVPISHGPYGEIVSGFFYGLLIPFIIVYINAPETLFTYAFAGGVLTAEFQVMPLIGLVLLAVLPTCLTANIMFANNICDLEHDIAVKRFTLAYYLKRKHALYLFAVLYYLSYASVVLMVALRYLPVTSLLLLLTLIPVQKNINAFFKKQVKEETFIVAIKNFLLIIIAHIVLIFVGTLLPGWGIG